MLDRIEVRGARQHNLQNIDVEIPRHALTVVTGLSGSGKSTLAFDTIYAEGQRRYVETLSPYARQFLDQFDRPDVDSIDGLSPALSIEQKTASRSSRSTVGTVTEIYDYLRLLYSSVGVPHCVHCKLPIQKQTPEQLAQRIVKRQKGGEISVLAPLVRGRKGQFRKELAAVARAGFVTARIDGSYESIDEGPPSIKLQRNVNHTIEVVVDRLMVRNNAQQRLCESIRTASKLAKGLVLIIDKYGKETLHSERLACVKCGASVPDLEPRSFSFNSRFGACESCSGLGVVWEFDIDKLIPHPERPLAKCGWPKTGRAGRVLGYAIEYAEEEDIDLRTPWNKLDEETQELLLYGYDEGWGYFGGLIPEIQLDATPIGGGPPPKEYRQYMYEQPCLSCGGARLSPEACAVRVAGQSISELATVPFNQLGERLSGLKLNPRERAVADPILAEIRQRIDFLSRVGLGYLWLHRSSATLSGGEAQRVRLATQIGSRLRGVLYVLDEPSIGLHARDHGRLLDTLAGLRDLGNTVVVVEHDQATIERADHIVDLGPGAGRFGGGLVASGTPDEVAGSGASLTGDYIAGRKLAYVCAPKRRKGSGRLVVRGARQHNLKGIDVELPVGTFCAVTGVSGSGKSTFVNGILYPALARHVGQQAALPGDYAGIDGLEHVDKVAKIDQTPLGRTPRSTPATYTGVFTPMREFFAELPESRARGYAPGRFSFNVKSGRCEECTGDGTKRIEMQFLPDVFVQCDACGGRRYNRETLQVLFKGHSIADLLESPVEDAVEIMRHLPSISRKLETLVDVGLGYIQLGQSSTTISGGEAQRMKLARELGKRRTGRTVYILDEPTTGLHFDDIRKLLTVLHRLVDKGGTVVVIEHQLDVVRSADWVIDLGPEGGDGGGEVVCAGTPEAVAACESSHTGRALREIGVR